MENLTAAHFLMHIQNRLEDLSVKILKINICSRNKKNFLHDVGKLELPKPLVFSYINIHIK